MLEASARCIVLFVWDLEAAGGLSDRCDRNVFPHLGGAVGGTVERPTLDCAYKPEEPVSEWRAASGMHSLALRARRESMLSPQATQVFGVLVNIRSDHITKCHTFG
jgi:hypothetical protein